MSEEIKKLLAKNKLLLGKDETLKSLKRGKIEKIYLASNTDAKTKKDVDYYKSIANITVEILSETNEELGVVCKKPFSISVIGVLK